MLELNGQRHIVFRYILEATLALQGGSKLKNAPVENISPHCEMLQKDFNLTVFQAYTRPRSRQSNFSRREEMSTSVFQSETIEKERRILWWNCQKISSSSLSILVWKEFNIFVNCVKEEPSSKVLLFCRVSAWKFNQKILLLSYWSTS